MLETPHFPGHAPEFETAVAMYAITLSPCDQRRFRATKTLAPP